MSISEYISPFVGRVVLAWFFLSEAWSRVSNFDATITLMRLQHVPAAAPLLVLALIVAVLGGLSIALGYQTRHGAVLLFGFIVVASVFMHSWWNLKNEIDRSADYDIFVRNMTIAGGLLFLVGMGPGPFALDNTGKKKR